MRNDDLQAKIKTAFDHAAPDILDSVLSDIASGNSDTKPILVMGGQNNMKNTIRNLTAIAAAAVLVIGGGAGLAVYNNNYKVASTISLDVNPSVEITANKKEDVLAVNALNDDGRKIIGDMDFSGSSIDVTVNALIGSMLREGYLSDLANSILISVEDDDANHGAQLRKKLADDVNAILQVNAFDGAVLSQTVVKDSDAWTLAEEYGITAGKAQLVSEIVAGNPVHTFDELAKLSINELNLLSTNPTVTTTAESVGQASDKAYIGRDRAKEIALENAGITEAAVRTLEIELDYEGGKMVYEVEIYADQKEYDYDIHAETGEILKYDTEHDDDDWVFDWNNQVYVQEEKPKKSSGMAEAPEGDYLSVDEVKTIVFEHAGVTEDTVFDLETEFDYDDGRAEYEIDFESGEFDYDYDVDAVTGEIRRDVKKYDPENLIEHGIDKESIQRDITFKEEDFAAVAESLKAGDLERIVAVAAAYNIILPAETVDDILLSRRDKPTFILTADDVSSFAGNLSTTEAAAFAYLINVADNQISSNTGYITAEEAKSIALSHAGVTETNVFDYDCEFDNEKGRAVYEIDFESMNYEHEYDIDAVTGEILKSEKEPLD
ncbi:MAG: PepSY domain-containing protein [Clostridia bacterium]|nr:PepSY domain-containing protein [Clostridia bacterium]